MADCNARFPRCCNRKKINSPGKTMQAASFPFPFSLIHCFQWRRRRRRKQQLKKGVFYFSLCQKLLWVIKSKWKTTLLGKISSTSCEQFFRPSSCLIMSPCDPRNIRLPIKKRVRNLDGTFGEEVASAANIFSRQCEREMWDQDEVLGRCHILLARFPPSPERGAHFLSPV